MRYKKANRIQEFKSVANRLDWRTFDQDHKDILTWLKDFKLFWRRHRRGLGPGMMTHPGDLEFAAVFDFEYQVHTNNSHATYRQTVYARYSKSLALPHFVMVPEKWYHRIGTALGMQDIDFEAYPQFSQNYLLQGADEDYIRHHFDHPEMIRFFGKNNFFSLEGMNYLMILYVHNVVMPAEQIAQLVNIGNALHNYLADKTPAIELPPDSATLAPPE